MMRTDFFLGAKNLNLPKMVVVRNDGDQSSWDPHRLKNHQNNNRAILQTKKTTLRKLAETHGDNYYEYYVT